LSDIGKETVVSQKWSVKTLTDEALRVADQIVIDACTNRSRMPVSSLIGETFADINIEASKRLYGYDPGTMEPWP